MPAKVLITRPYDQARLFAAEVERLGALPLYAPLLEIVSLPCEFPRTLPEALVITSRHALTKNIPLAWKDLPVFVVGESVASAASAAGFSQIKSVSTTVADLCAVLSRAPYQDIAYLRGQDITADMATSLPAKHMTEYIVYEARAASSLPQDIVEQMSNIAVVTLFSSRTAQIWTRLMDMYGLNHYRQQIKLLCLSPAVLDSARKDGWLETYVADLPDQSAMIAALEKILQVHNDNRHP